VIEQAPPWLLQLKVQLRDVRPAVGRRVLLGDSLSIADLHRVIQLLMGWDDEHLQRFRIHGQDYGVDYIKGHPLTRTPRLCPYRGLGSVRQSASFMNTTSPMAGRLKSGSRRSSMRRRPRTR
jgi:Plasmid pRiA4b ORF-3-like protein